MDAYPKVNTIWKHRNSGEVFVVGPRANMEDGSRVAITINMSNSDGGFEVWRCEKFFKMMEHQPVTQDDIVGMLKERKVAN